MRAAMVAARIFFHDGLPLATEAMARRGFRS